MRVAVAEDALDAYMNSGMDLKLYQPKAMVRMQSRTLALILSEHAFVSSGSDRGDGLGIALLEMEPSTVGDPGP